MKWPHRQHRRRPAPVQKPASDDELKLRDLVCEFSGMLRDSKVGPHSEEIRLFIKKHEHFLDFKSLALTLILLCEPRSPLGECDCVSCLERHAEDAQAHSSEIPNSEPGGSG